MRHRHLTFSSALCMALLLAATAGAQKGAAAQDPAKAKSSQPKKSAKAHAGKDAPSPQAKAAIESATRLMASKNAKEIEAGIQSLGLLGTKEAVEPLVARIHQGLPAELLEAAIVTLMALGQPSAGPALYELTAHRRAEVRLRAIEAITAIHPPGAEQALAAALSDADTKVRSAAATGLGDIGAKDALEKLFLALDRGNFEASGAIGKVIDPSDVRRLASYLGKLPFHKLGPALAQVFQRSDVSESAKLELVARLEEVGTKEVKGYLGDLVSSSGQALPQAVSRALLRAMQEIAD
ncbi:MAG: HEAT repeat domain-containing protein [Polyangiales bacterium]